MNFRKRTKSGSFEISFELTMGVLFMLCIGWTGYLFYGHWSDSVTDEDAEFRARFATAQVGWSKTRIIDRFGVPNTSQYDVLYYRNVHSQVCSITVMDGFVTRVEFDVECDYPGAGGHDGWR
jgi:hypothetical protein